EVSRRQRQMCIRDRVRNIRKSISQTSWLQRLIDGGSMTDLYDVNVALVHGELYDFERGLYI
ncbi:hypothetical protein ACN6QQ_14600, partial [Acinetobacter baumannii]